MQKIKEDMSKGKADAKKAEDEAYKSKDETGVKAAEYKSRCARARV